MKTIEKLSSYRTPYYLYDTELLRATLESLTSEASRNPAFHVHYAIKANANPLVLREIVKFGIGIDCVSGGEIETSISSGFAGSDIVFAGVGKSDWEIALGLENNIFSFNVESIPELEVINSIATNMHKIANICLRINPDVDAHTHSHITTGKAENKFGIPKADMLKVIRLCHELPNINFRGLHFHIGSQILDMEPFKELCENINNIQAELESNGIHLEIINVGGGLGIDYNNPELNPIPDFKSYFSTFNDNLKLREGQEVHFELGRAIVAQCGSLITKVLYVKEGELKDFVIVDGGMSELIRPALYEAYHKIDNISLSQRIHLTDMAVRSDQKSVYDVVGPICESSDVFVKDYSMPTTHRGDLIAIRSAGAYGETMSSVYNCRPLPRSHSLSEIN